MKIRYATEGMKTDLITTKVKEKNIYREEKVINEAELIARTKKKAQNNHYHQEMRTECIN